MANQIIECDACDRICTVNTRGAHDAVIQFCPFCGDYVDDDTDDKDEEDTESWPDGWRQADEDE